MTISNSMLVPKIMQQIDASLNNFVLSGYQAASNYLKNSFRDNCSDLYLNIRL